MILCWLGRRSWGDRSCNNRKIFHLELPGMTVRHGNDIPLGISIKTMHNTDHPIPSTSNSGFRSQTKKCHLCSNSEATWTNCWLSSCQLRLANRLCVAFLRCTLRIWLRSSLRTHAFQVCQLQFSRNSIGTCDDISLLLVHKAM